MVFLPGNIHVLQKLEMSDDMKKSIMFMEESD